MRKCSAQTKTKNLEAVTSELTKQIQKMTKRLNENSFKEMLSIKPEYKRISSFYPLSKYSEDQSQRKYLPFYKSLREQYPYVRFVLNDGNSFYRSFAFQYLTKIANLSFHNCVTTKRKLKKCDNLPYQLESLEIKDMMYNIWKLYLLPLVKLSKIERKKKILDLFNSSYLFDSIFIAFFRALSYNVVLSSKHIKSMMKDGEQIQNILIYGHPVHQCEIAGLAQLFSVKISQQIPYKTSYDITPQTIQKGHCVFLMGMNNGYNILCQEKDIQKETQETNFRQYVPITHMNTTPAKISNKIARGFRLMLYFFGILTLVLVVRFIRFMT